MPPNNEWLDVFDEKYEQHCDEGELPEVAAIHATHDADEMVYQENIE